MRLSGFHGHGLVDSGVWVWGSLALRFAFHIVSCVFVVIAREPPTAAAAAAAALAAAADIALVGCTFAG